MKLSDPWGPLHSGVSTAAGLCIGTAEQLFTTGIFRDGSTWTRALLIQMAWRWLRHQPESALSKWFEERAAGGRGRIRRVMIVALAQKLLIALWRFSETGLVPTGARLA